MVYQLTDVAPLIPSGRSRPITPPNCANLLSRFATWGWVDEAQLLRFLKTKATARVGAKRKDGKLKRREVAYVGHG